MEKNTVSILKQFLPHIVVVIFFIALSILFFNPLLEGKSLKQGDVLQWRGMSQELIDFDKTHPDTPAAWTGSMFSGMPAYNIGVWGYPSNSFKYIQKSLSLGNGGSVGPLFAGLICAYIFFFLLTGNVFASVLGAVACAFSSYNLIIIPAGHVTKAWAIAYMPLVLSGLLVVFRKKYLLGGGLLAIALALELLAGHIQITYYLAILCLILFVGYAIHTLIKKEFIVLGRVSLTLVIAIAFAVLPRVGGLYSDYEMSKKSMRGPSELTAIKAEPNSKASTGLEIDYAFNWSYGKGETLSFLIPNIRGGESGGKLGSDSHLYKELKDNGARPEKGGIQAYTYWGEQPFTSGPVYLGAGICFLFVLGMFVVRSKAKWWLFGSALLFIFLSWGYNFAWFNDYLFYHLPMYNKFRTPSMALVIPALILPIIAVWGLKDLSLFKGNKKRLNTYLLASIGITGIICLALWGMPNWFYDFQSSNDEQFTSQVPGWYYNALLEDRASLLASDAFRSLAFILLIGACVYLFMNKTKKMFNLSLAAITVLVLIDLWVVDKRYLNDSHFEKKKSEKVFELTQADKFILEDKSPSYRVLNLPSNTFNETTTAYFHKSIGGYHAAKLRRYQELIDHRISKEMQSFIGTLQTVTSLDDVYQVFQSTPTLNMLNAKYFIYSPEQVPFTNPNANGNAWFVQNIQWVDNADQEIAALDSINPKTTAVINRKFAGLVDEKARVSASSDTIELVEYQPIYLKYQSNTSSDQLAVFSEIYYKDNGWKAFIDGKPVDHIQVDWVLRAMNVPAGQHTIEFRFEPDTYNRLMYAGITASWILIVGFIGILAFSIVKKRKAQ